MATFVTQNPASFTALPIEIITQIITKLHKFELKTLRLTCHYFDEASLSLLFDRVIFSDQRPNLAPFRSVTSNPRLNTHVQTLVYDMQWFDDLKEAHYILGLYRQLKEDVSSRIADLGSSILSSQLEEKLVACNYFADPGTTHDRERFLLPWNKYVRIGYQEYRKQWEGQNWCASQPFYLVSELRNCSNIRRVEVRASWDFHYPPLDDRLESLLPRYPSSGFVGRHWHPLYLRPKNPSQSTLHQRVVAEDIFNAVRVSGKHISHISFGDGCTIGPEMHKYSQSMLIEMPIIFQPLTSLSLDIAVDLPPPSLYMTNCLSQALHTAQNLTHLTFRAKNYSAWRHKDGMRWWIYYIFHDCIFPKLTDLRLTGMAASAEEFLIIFRNQPLLQALHLESIDLLVQLQVTQEGWRYLLEHLRQVSLKEFSVTWPLRISKNVSNGWFGCPEICETHQWSWVKDTIERYVLHGDVPLVLGQFGGMGGADEDDA
ncbi:MAG: hypothetical protein Q9211_006753 [Gyalolechia sp. 1 TL-2023]